MQENETNCKYASFLTKKGMFDYRMLRDEVNK